MPVLVDPVHEYPNSGLANSHWCHMAVDGCFEELHAFAATLSIPRARFQGDHYDLPPWVRERAVSLGALEVSTIELLRRMAGPRGERARHRLRERFAAARRDSGFVVLEGFHAVKHALRFGAEVRPILTADPARLRELVAQLAPDLAARPGGAARPPAAATADLAALASPVPPALLAELVPRVPSTGVVAIARRPAVDVAAALAGPGPVVLLEHPRHLGNLGAAIRVAAAAGAAALLVTGPADPWHPDAVRGAAGLQFALPVARLDALPDTGRPLVALDPAGEPLSQLPDRAILAFGTERHGLSPELLARAHARVALPMRAGVSSLNLATAVAAVLFQPQLRE
jgi:RNA methyltransferase, TrmH family